jgi:hypothetical protein
MIRRLMALFILAGVALVAVAVPLARGRVPPNAWYGVRTPKTLRDRTAWYPANAYGGRLLIGVGAITILVAVGAALVLGGRSPRPVSLYATICTIVLLGALAVTVVLILLRIRSLP